MDSRIDSTASLGAINSSSLIVFLNSCFGMLYLVQQLAKKELYSVSGWFVVKTFFKCHFWHFREREYFLQHNLQGMASTLQVLPSLALSSGLIMGTMQVRTKRKRLLFAKVR